MVNITPEWIEDTIDVLPTLQERRTAFHGYIAKYIESMWVQS